MQIHELQPKYKMKKKKRIGRGGKRGTYSGKGMKGQKSRAGTKRGSIVEKGRSSWVKRFPKLGGFQSVYLKNIVVKTSQIERYFKAGETVDEKSLIKKEVIHKPKRSKTGKKQLIKILNDTPLTKKVTLSGCLVSKTVQTAIKKAGGDVKDLPKRKKKQEKV
jgi:large subunit ribosomal protein L15